MGLPALASVVRDEAPARALVDPVRRRLLLRLATPNSATGLAREEGIPRQRVNYHLRELERAGLVELVEERRKRGCSERIVRATAATYLISPDVLGDLATDPSNVRDKMSWAYLVAVAARAIRELATLRQRADAVGKRLATLTLHADVRFASQARLNEFSEELSNTVARLVAKYNDDAAPGGRTYRFFVGAHPAITKTDEEARAEAEAAGGAQASGKDPDQR